ncbi:ABC transporter permease [Salirhabdus salicampi]|uniref:ABC transporter permease n=1 Tax=Salirhabdus salicampi TaxID=476102 RepID=UPI0020C54ACC|nr:iron ABC transporter permease [Salirhabdus salicampi]MCP8615864.1 iron ABC transporter permease [Salirhabdus salicampi]
MGILQSIKKHANSWAILSIILLIIVILPNSAILFQMFTAPNENWEHIQQFMLIKYVGNTLLIVTLTSVLTIILGTSLAWLMAAYNFPLRRFFKWGILLPLAFPPYIAAYTYHGILDYTGVLQTTLRKQGIYIDQRFVDIMNIQGTIFIFTLFLYPYVYSLTHAYLVKQSASLIENARLLGKSGFQIFIQIVIPISRVAIVGGVSLVALEVLNDYGVVEYYGIQTFTTAIFQTWFGLGDLHSTMKLAGILIGVVLVILIVEKILRGRKQFSFSTSDGRSLRMKTLSPRKGMLVTAYCFVIFSLGFLIPVTQLIGWMLRTYNKVLNEQFFSIIKNSILVASAASLSIVVISLIVANFTRLTKGWIANASSKVMILGYSTPGSVIAVGVLTMMIALDQRVIELYSFLGVHPSFVFSTSLFMLIFAYIIRFLAIGYNSIESGFEKIGNQYTEASRMLGMNVTKTFFLIDIKLIKHAVMAGFILSFVETLKELPLTLLLSPFNFSTLSTKAFQYASDEMIQEAALPSLLIIFISGLFIFLFHHYFEKEL